jgi:hypothetical protein
MEPKTLNKTAAQLFNVARLYMDKPILKVRAGKLVYVSNGRPARLPRQWEGKLVYVIMA